ncbi:MULTISPECIES: hypothetical protein [unclassified Mesorhizobium]|uniref:hypothetical protein n=1 Tax=Mesorhizobium sp. M4A.F.Ca.ET.090.04.2.1 TaxID=2496663 RepID=UPI002479EAF1|nr:MULTISPECIES: hypothetical protein [unclassified Mesorhizobium]
MSLHVAHGFPGGIDNGTHANLERPLPIFAGRRENISSRDDSGVVDEHVEPPCRLNGVLDQILAIVLAPEVTGFGPDILSG